MKLRLMKIDPAVQMPLRANPGDAGADLFAWLPKKPVILNPGQRAVISTGISMSIEHGYEVQIRPRSGLAFKHGITVLNSPGTIDSGYRGVVGVILINLGDAPFEVRHGDRVAQMVVCAVPDADFIEVSSLDQTEREAGGFGSTGV